MASFILNSSIISPGYGSIPIVPDLLMKIVVEFRNFPVIYFIYWQCRIAKIAKLDRKFNKFVENTGFNSEPFTFRGVSIVA